MCVRKKLAESKKFSLKSVALAVTTQRVKKHLKKQKQEERKRQRNENEKNEEMKTWKNDNMKK